MPKGSVAQNKISSPFLDRIIALRGSHLRGETLTKSVPERADRLPAPELLSCRAATRAIRGAYRAPRSVAGALPASFTSFARTPAEHTDEECLFRACRRYFLRGSSRLSGDASGTELNLHDYLLVPPFNP